MHFEAQKIFSMLKKPERFLPKCKSQITIKQHVLDTNAGENCLKLPQMSNECLCWKNEIHLNIDLNFDHQMSLSKR